MFTYDCDHLCTPAICGHHEIDIEFAGDALIPGPENAQYVVQPYETCLLDRFRIDLHTSASTHRFWWLASAIDFASWYGHRPAAPHPDSLIRSLSYCRDTVPPCSATACIAEPVKRAPEPVAVRRPAARAGEEVEIIIKGSATRAARRRRRPRTAGKWPVAEVASTRTFPIPFNPATVIGFRVGEPSGVSLRIMMR
jgi:hypothetical protein